MLGWNVGLALVWCALTGRLGIAELSIGFAVGYLLIGWLIPSDDARAYLRRLPLLVGFFAYYSVEVIVSSLRIAWEVVTPRARRRPGIIVVPLDVKTDAQIALLLAIVTFTPGTVALDLAPDRRTMLVHDMVLVDAETSRERIKRRYERWVVRLLG
jgi:multicomponent Na+:H+ antiporter subunit E